MPRSGDRQVSPGFSRSVFSFLTFSLRGHHSRKNTKDFVQDGPVKEKDGKEKEEASGDCLVRDQALKRQSPVDASSHCLYFLFPGPTHIKDKEHLAPESKENKRQ